jgi:hypothetical protein
VKKSKLLLATLALLIGAMSVAGAKFPASEPQGERAMLQLQYTKGGS